MPYTRIVKTTSGATAVQVVWSSRRGSREIEHLGSAHDEAELEVMDDMAIGPGWEAIMRRSRLLLVIDRYQDAGELPWRPSAPPATRDSSSPLLIGPRSRR